MLIIKHHIFSILPKDQIFSVKMVVSIIFLLNTVNSFSQTIIVKQDGSGDFTKIQQGIDAANNGDTVLVWPGTYFENVLCKEKYLILASLTMTTGNPQYIYQTIIDGQQDGSCVRIEDCNNEFIIHGFTIQNGNAFGQNASKTNGGGILIEFAKTRVKQCIIKNNIAAYGGGIFSGQSQLYLSGSTIKNNHAFHSGGGINSATNYIIGSLIFDTIDLCNIYMNYAAVGTDVYKVSQDSLHINLDTATIVNPDYYYFHSSMLGLWVDDITYEINSGIMVPCNQDLYISPDGDNSNTGYSPNDPLKNVSYALLKMVSDSLSLNTIYLSNGIYSPSMGERFPLCLKAHVNIFGDNKDSTILDAENIIYHMNGIQYADSYLLKNITLQNGNGDSLSIFGVGSFQVFLNRNSRIDNVVFKNNKGMAGSIGGASLSDGFAISNSFFIDNMGGSSVFFGYWGFGIQPDTNWLINCRIINNQPDYSIPSDQGGNGGGLSIYGHQSNPAPGIYTAYMLNCLFYNNHTRTHPFGGMSQVSVIASRNSESKIINCTFGNNTSDNPLGGNIGITDDSDLSVYNCILYNTNEAELYMYTDKGTSNLNIYNSLVKDGEQGIRLYTGNNNVYYDPSNIDTDPLWDTTSIYPYSLSAGSPCIDAGTLNLPPGLELPDTDLAGNPRVYNGYVDMGAYEYGPWVQTPYYEKPEKQELLKAWPNPFRFETTIWYKSTGKGHTLLRIYDLSGNIVKTLLDVHGLSGSGKIRWNGKDRYGNELEAGTYIISLLVNGTEKGVIKIMKL